MERAPPIDVQLARLQSQEKWGRAAVVVLARRSLGWRLEFEGSGLREESG